MTVIQYVALYLMQNWFNWQGKLNWSCYDHFSTNWPFDLLACCDDQREIILETYTRSGMLFIINRWLWPNLNSTIASQLVNLGFEFKRERVFWSPIPQSRHMSRWDEPIEWSQPIKTDFPSWLAGRYHWRTAEHRKRLRTTNGLERYKQEVRRRTRVVRIFPNRASCLWLTSALAMKQSEDWLTGHRYLNMHLLEDEPILFTSVDLLAQETVTTWSLGNNGNMSHCEGAESTHKTWHNWRGHLDIRYHKS
jgi:hypothetical protein